MSGLLEMDTKEYKDLVLETEYEMCLNEIDKIIASKYTEFQVIFYRVDAGSMPGGDLARW